MWLLVLEEHRRDREHGLELLEAFLDGGLPAVGSEDLLDLVSVRSLVKSGYIPSLLRS